jgi:hypothetical protein
VKKYLEDLIAQVETPQLSHLSISYFNQLDFQVPELSEFISRTQNLFISRFTCAQVDFDVNDVRVRLYERDTFLKRHFSLRISCRWLDWQLGHVTQILRQLGIMLSNVGGLPIDVRDLPPGGSGWIDDTVWLELFRPFTSVETLHVVSGKSASQLFMGSMRH